MQEYGSNLEAGIAEATNWPALEIRVREAGNPVLLIPGYCEPLALFAYVGRAIEDAGRETFGMDEHFPGLQDIRLSAELLREKVRAALRQTGASRVDLVAHSQGGLMSRYFIKFLGGEDLVDRCVLLATPNHGTYMAYLGVGEAARQMRPDSEFIRELNEGRECHGDIRYTSIWTRFDQIVVPKTSAILEGARNFLLPGGFHNQMMFTEACKREVLKSLAEPVPHLEAVRFEPVVAGIPT